MRQIELRNESIYKEKIEGATLESLVEKYGLSSGSIRNIIHNVKMNKVAPSDNLSETTRELKNTLYEMDVSKYACTVLFKCLIRGGVNSLAQLQAMSSDEVLRIRGVGKTMVDALEKHNLIK